MFSNSSEGHIKSKIVHCAWTPFIAAWSIFFIRFLCITPLVFTFDSIDLSGQETDQPILIPRASNRDVCNTPRPLIPAHKMPFSICMRPTGLSSNSNVNPYASLFGGAAVAQVERVGH